jgi:uncharacterized protein
VTEPRAAIDALQPWPDAVDWRPVSPKLITVELIGRTAITVVMLIALIIGWVVAEHWLWPVAMAVVVLFAIWRTIVTIRQGRVIVRQQRH